MSSVSYQSNALDISYNGWENYETWNVALWIGNDEGLYHLSQECETYENFVNFLDEVGIHETGDGVRYDDPRVNVIQIESDLFDY